MSERTYPREWFEVSRYGSTPTPRMFVRETEKKLVWIDHAGCERRTDKRTSYSTWFPTLDEAEAQLAVYRGARERQEADRRLRNAAPELLEAAEHMLVAHESESATHYRDAIAKLKAALAKATSPQGEGSQA